MAFGIGREMREKYAVLLAPDYSPAKVRFRSTDTSRTIGSAQYTAAGLFAPPTVKTWQNSLQYQSVQIETIPWDDDYDLNQLHSCNKIDQLRAAYVDSASIKAEIKKYPAMCTFLEQNSGSQAREVDDFFKFYDSLNIERMGGFA